MPSELTIALPDLNGKVGSHDGAESRWTRKSDSRPTFHSYLYYTFDEGESLAWTKRIEISAFARASSVFTF